jgi:hypothetical protein
MNANFAIETTNTNNRSQTMNSQATLKMTAGVHEFLKQSTRQAAHREFFGVLTRTRRQPDLATGATLLPAQATGAHAAVSPAVLRQTLDDLRVRNLEVHAMVHSHANFSVFHSGTDEETIHRLLPGLAALQPVAAAGPPVVLGQDQARLDLCDGRRLVLTLLGDEVPGLGGHQRAAWSHVHTTFGETSSPKAVLSEDDLVVEGSGVQHRLGIPAGAKITLQFEQASTRWGRSYSLVVNRRGDLFAEALLVCDVEGHLCLEKERCTVEIVPDETPDLQAVNRNYLQYEELTARDAFGQPRRGALYRVWEGNGHVA